MITPIFSIVTAFIVFVQSNLKLLLSDKKQIYVFPHFQTNLYMHFIYFLIKIFY